ncbi:MAG: PQQ-binding-like beta-propeller repeat protein [bacterium]|nr:hypothetical protein [Gammaproteobacteria bacterium]HIL96613.1 hypothetical protein [Pseudomonadales bacterium]
MNSFFRLTALLVLSLCSYLMAAAEDGSQHYQFTQITSDNISQLKLAFSYRTGDFNAGFKGKAHSFQATPAYWQGMLFVSTSDNQVMAINAANGKEIWRFDAKIDRDLGYSESASRGVALWHGEDKQCPDRVFIGTHMAHFMPLTLKPGNPAVISRTRAF